MPRRKRLNISDLNTCHDHAREALQEGEEDDDGAVGVDVARTIPERHLFKQVIVLMNNPMVVMVSTLKSKAEGKS